MNGRVNKAVSSVLMTILCISILTGCDSNKEKISKQPEETKQEESKPKRSLAEEILVSHKWKYYDYDIMENSNFTCNEDGEFYYFCDCGEPIGDYDLFDEFKFDAQNQSIRILGLRMERQAKVLAYNDTHMTLNLEGTIRDFYNADYAYSVPVIGESHREQVEGYTGYKTVLSMSEDKLVLNIPDVDRENVKAHPYSEIYALAEQVSYQSMVATETKSATEETYFGEDSYSEDEMTYQLDEMTKEEAIRYVENGADAFVWMNEALEVEKIMFYSRKNMVSTQDSETQETQTE